MRAVFVSFAITVILGNFLQFNVSADTSIIVAQKKTSPKSKTIKKQIAAPKITSIISTSEGYKIKGSGFGTDTSNFIVYEGKKTVSKSSVKNLRDTSVDVRSKPSKSVGIRVSINGSSSNSYKYFWEDSKESGQKSTIQKTTKKQSIKSTPVPTTSSKIQTKKQKTTKRAKPTPSGTDKNEITKKSVETSKIKKSQSSGKGKINDLKTASKTDIQTKKQKKKKSAEPTPTPSGTNEITKKAVQTSKVDKSRTTEKDKIDDLKLSSKSNIKTKKQKTTKSGTESSTQTITKSKTKKQSISTDPIKSIGDVKGDRTIKPTIKPLPTAGDKSTGGLNPIGRPGGTSSGGTMTAMNTGNSACNSCHLPVLESFPFWNWETSENDDTVRFVRLKKPVSGSHPVWRGIKVDGWDAQFQSSNPNVVALTGSVNIDTLYMQQGIDIRGPGTATITGMSRFRSGISPEGEENWHILPQVSRQIVVTAAATQIESFSFSPNPASVPGTTQGIVTFDGGTGEQTWVKWQRVGPGDARAGGVSEQTKSVPVGASQISFDHQTVDVSGSGTGSGNATIRVRWVRQGSSGFAEEIDQASTTLNVQDAVEIVDNSFSALLNNIFHDAKCLNCHGMASNNQTLQQHTNPNSPRFTIPQGQSRIQFISNVDNCSGCHSSSNGYADNWHAPPSNMNWTGKSAVQTCNTTVSNTIPQTPEQMKHHLKDDLLIQWAINRMGAKGSGWNQKFNAWVDSWNGDDKNCD